MYALYTLYMKPSTEKPIRTYVHLKDGSRRVRSRSFTIYGITVDQAQAAIFKALGINKDRKAG